jgi:hypothetical protein
MAQYDSKINIYGEYTPFHSWGVLLTTKSSLKFIENFIKNNKILNKYYSALPSETYHVTVYTVWYNGIPLINHQKKFIKANYSEEKSKQLEAQSKKIGYYFNPDNCLDYLLYKCAIECEKHNLDNAELSIQDVYIHRQIGIPFQFTFCNSLRNNLINICDHNDNAGCPHMTLAYLYNDFPPEMEEAIQREINILKSLIKNQRILFNAPAVYYGSDMITWTKYDTNVY